MNAIYGAMILVSSRLLLLPGPEADRRLEHPAQTHSKPDPEEVGAEIQRQYGVVKSGLGCGPGHQRLNHSGLSFFIY